MTATTPTTLKQAWTDQVIMKYLHQEQYHSDIYQDSELSETSAPFNNSMTQTHAKSIKNSMFQKWQKNRTTIFYKF
jgi:hypothetical protein